MVDETVEEMPLKPVALILHFTSADKWPAHVLSCVSASFRSIDFLTPPDNSIVLVSSLLVFPANHVSVCWLRLKPPPAQRANALLEQLVVSDFLMWNCPVAEREKRGVTGERLMSAR